MFNLVSVKEGENFNRMNTLSILRIPLKVAPSGLKTGTVCRNFHLTLRWGQRGHCDTVSKDRVIRVA